MCSYSKWLALLSGALCMAFADPCCGCLSIQAQDETEETVSALAEVHAINNAISFGCVPIAPIDVCTGCAALLHCIWVAVEQYLSGMLCCSPHSCACRQGSVQVWGCYFGFSLAVSSNGTSPSGA